MSRLKESSSASAEPLSRQQVPRASSRAEQYPWELMFVDFGGGTLDGAGSLDAAGSLGARSLSKRVAATWV